MLGWSVEIAGFDGSTSVCIVCSPAEPIECVRQHDRTYDEAAPHLVEPPFDDGESKSPNSVRTESVQVDFEEWAE